MNDMTLPGPVRELPTDTAFLGDLEIAPENPRSNHTVDPTDIDALADNIREHGVLTPLIVYEEGGTFFVTAGGRRLRALRLLAETEAVGAFPILCTGKANAITLGAAEQLTHVRMSPADELRIYAHPSYKGRAVKVLAALTGRTVKYVTQRLAVLALPEAIVQSALNGTISVDQACGLTYFSDDEARLSEMFEACVWRPELDGDALRAAHLRELSEWSSNPFAQHVTMAAYVAAGGRLQQDLFSDATIILTPSVLSDLAAAAIQDKIEAEFPDAAFVLRLDDTQSTYSVRTHRGIVQGTEEQREYLANTYRYQLTTDEGRAEYDHIEAACKPIYPPELSAMLGVAWAMSRHDKLGYTLRSNALPDDMEPLYEAGYAQRPVLPGDDPNAPAEADAAGLSAAMKLRITRIKAHSVRMDLAAKPDDVIALYLNHALGHARQAFRQIPEETDQPDDFLRCEVSPAYVKLLDFYAPSAIVVAEMKPAEHRKALVLRLLSCLSAQYAETVTHPERVRAYWAPNVEFFMGYKRPDLNAMVQAISPDAAQQLAPGKKLGLIEYLEAHATKNRFWLPVGF